MNDLSDFCLLYLIVEQTVSGTGCSKNKPRKDLDVDWGQGCSKRWVTGGVGNRGRIGIRENRGRIGIRENRGRIGIPRGRIGIRENRGRIGIRENRGRIGIRENRGRTGIRGNRGGLAYEGKAWEHPRGVFADLNGLNMSWTSGRPCES